MKNDWNMFGTLVLHIAHMLDPMTPGFHRGIYVGGGGEKRWRA